MQVAAASNQSTDEDPKIKTAVSSTMSFMLNGDGCWKSFARTTLRMELTELRKS